MRLRARTASEVLVPPTRWKPRPPREEMRPLKPLELPWAILPRDEVAYLGVDGAISLIRGGGGGE